jgi:Pvc16 N-terminal domain
VSRENEKVIHDADRSLAAWLATALPDGVAVTFDPPEPSWAQRSPRLPFVNAFLYDIREDGTGVSADLSPVRAPNGALVGRRPAVRRYRLSFLLTAWAAEIAAGHELLGSIMAAFAADDVIPPGCLHGTLAEAGMPVALRCAPGDQAGSPLQLWQSLGVPPRTAVVLEMTVPLVPAPRTGLAPPARQLDLDLASEPGGIRPRAGADGTLAAEEEPAAGANSAPPPSAPRWERGRITERHS